MNIAFAAVAAALIKFLAPITETNLELLAALSSQPNIQLKEVTFDVSQLETSIEVKLQAFQNIDRIVVISEVSKFPQFSIVVKLDISLNIQDASVLPINLFAKTILVT